MTRPYLLDMACTLLSHSFTLSHHTLLPPFFLSAVQRMDAQPDETWKNKLSPDQYYVLRMVSRPPPSLRNLFLRNLRISAHISVFIFYTSKSVVVFHF